jgi:hypothetical protein
MWDGGETLRKRKEQAAQRIRPVDAGSTHSSSIGRLFVLLLVVAAVLNGAIIYMYRRKSLKPVGTPGAFGAKEYQPPRLALRRDDNNVQAHVEALRKAVSAGSATVPVAGNASAEPVSRVSWQELAQLVSDAYAAALGDGSGDLFRVALAELGSSQNLGSVDRSVSRDGRGERLRCESIGGFVCDGLGN